jgi:hypothetical protein
MKAITWFIYEEVASVVSKYYHPPFQEPPLHPIGALLG